MTFHLGAAERHDAPSQVTIREWRQATLLELALAEIRWPAWTSCLGR
jgi:hypothetical protein